MTQLRWTPFVRRFATRSSGSGKPPDEWPTVQDLRPWPSPNKPPARSDDLRGKQFSTHRPGYDKEQVDAFLDKAEPRLAAMRATDKGAT